MQKGLYFTLPFHFFSRSQLNEIADKEDGKTRLEKEFDNIQATIHREPIVFTGTSSPNRHKNRYANVIPCKRVKKISLFFYLIRHTLITAYSYTLLVDKTRCKLSTIPGVEGSDYINANFIEVCIVMHTKARLV